jgi:hypothetical protein
MAQHALRALLISYIFSLLCNVVMDILWEDGLNSFKNNFRIKYRGKIHENYKTTRPSIFIEK